jgi:septum formation protein
MIRADVSRTEGMPLILASGSTTRRDMLRAAGLELEIHPADVDERAIRDRLVAQNYTIERTHIAEALATAKAEAVSALRPHALVIGADQILAFGSEIFEKPRDVSDARAGLMKLRSHKHQLHSSVTLAVGGRAVWSNTSTATLHMRSFSEVALDEYLARAGDAVLTSVGAYQIEGPAIQLFERIDGDYTTILGLPLLPLLAELRNREVIPA